MIFIDMAKNIDNSFKTFVQDWMNHFTTDNCRNRVDLDYIGAIKNRGGLLCSRDVILRSRIYAFWGQTNLPINVIKYIVAISSNVR